jgi:GT2 family glycosyltransferase
MLKTKISTGLMASGGNTLVSIIIVNYNTHDLLRNCIDSIFDKSSFLDFEIIVVDNASKYNCSEMLQQRYNSRVVYIQLPENIGFGRANNIGLERSNGKYVLFMNPDTELINNAIEMMTVILEKDHRIGIVGGNLFDDRMKPAYSYRRFFPSLFWEINSLLSNLPERIWYGNNSVFNNAGKPIDVAYITGACLMMSKELVLKIGMFDPNFFLFFEETDLAYRAKKSGYRIVCIPDAHIMHLEGGSFDANSSRAEHYFAGREIYFRKNVSRTCHLISNAILLLGVQVRLFLYGVISPGHSRIDELRNIKKGFLISKNKLNQ